MKLFNTIVISSLVLAVSAKRKVTGWQFYTYTEAEYQGQSEYFNHATTGCWNLGTTNNKVSSFEFYDTNAGLYCIRMYTDSGCKGEDFASSTSTWRLPQLRTNDQMSSFKVAFSC